MWCGVREWERMRDQLGLSHLEEAAAATSLRSTSLLCGGAYTIAPRVAPSFTHSSRYFYSLFVCLVNWDGFLFLFLFFLVSIVALNFFDFTGKTQNTTLKTRSCENTTQIQIVYYDANRSDTSYAITFLPLHHLDLIFQSETPNSVSNFRVRHKQN